MFKQITEPFLGSDDPNTIGTKKIQQYYAESLPNAIYTQDSALPLSAMTQTADQRLTGTQPILKDIWAVKSLDDDLLGRRQAECEAVGTGDQFDHLNSLANSYDRRSRARCGWVYNNAKPSDGRGAFGTVEGAFKTSAQGTWMWNLEKAREKYHTSICAEVLNCEDLESSQYKGRCGWCKKSGKAVPIVGGKIAYPYSTLTACPADSLVTTGGTCPPPPPPLPPGVARSPANMVSPARICDPQPNGNLARDCLIQKAKQAGCSDDGTLVAALQTGSDMNYFDTLSRAASYILYQERAVVNLDEVSLKTGKTTIDQALDEFKRVNDNAASSIESGLQVAARDLCYKAGTMDTFDFCTEIQDSAMGPFKLDCLQKEFMRAGGQKTGLMYPSDSNLSMWNSNNKWLDVKRTIQLLSDNVRSSDRGTQEQAMRQFYGIPLEDKTRPALAPIAGAEIFWFTHDTSDLAAPTIFLGRRIRSKVPMINQTNDLKGVNNLANVSMVFFTNLGVSADKKIRVRVTSDDGFAVHLNKPLGVGYRTGLIMNDANNLTALDYFPPTTFTTNIPWKLRSSGPNVINGYWFQGGGGLYFKMEMQDYSAENGGPWTEAPTDIIKLTQEPYAPMMSFQVYRAPQDFGADFNFADKRLGSLKMKWFPAVGTPTWIYSASQGNVLPLGLPMIRFRSDTAISTKGFFKMYSFMTMTMLVTFNSVPSSNTNMDFFWTVPRGGADLMCIRMIGTGNNSASIGLLSGFGRPVVVKMASGVSISPAKSYLIALRILRSNENDIYSVYGASLEAQELSTLRNDPNTMGSTGEIPFQDPKVVSNPDGQEAHGFQLGYQDIDVSFIRFYDYKLDAAGIAREVKNDWQYL